MCSPLLRQVDRGAAEQGRGDREDAPKKPQDESECRFAVYPNATLRPTLTSLSQ